MKKLILLLMVSLFLISFVSAVPPVTTTQSFSEGYILNAPFLKYGKCCTDYEIAVHVYNISNGKQIWGAGITCHMHGFDRNGTSLFAIDGVIHDEHYDFDIGGGNFTNSGIYGYSIHCNNTILGGYASGTININATGEELTISKAIIYMGTFLILIFLFIITIGGIGWLPSKNKEDDNLLSINKLKYLRMVLFFVGWMLLTSIVYIGANICLGHFQTTLVGDLFFTLFSIMFRLTIPAVILIGLWILTNIFEDRKLKQLFDRGFEMGDKQ